MHAPFSVIIPTLNAQDVLPDTFDTLLSGVAQGVLREVIVSDGGSTDRTVALAEACGAEVIKGSAGRGPQLARGASLARGSWLLFLHADTHLPKQWVGALATHMTGSPDMAAAFRLRFRARGVAARATAAWANLRSSALGLPYGDQGLFVSRRLYDEMGGYADLPLMEDVEMAGRLRGRLRLLDETVSTSAQRYERSGWIRRGGGNLLTLARYYCGADPARLAARYHKS